MIEYSLRLQSGFWIAHVYRIDLVIMFWNPFGSVFDAILICLKQFWNVVVCFHREVNNSCEDFINWEEACFECHSIWWFDITCSCIYIKNGVQVFIWRNSFFIIFEYFILPNRTIGCIIWREEGLSLSSCLQNKISFIFIMSVFEQCIIWSCERNCSLCSTIQYIDFKWLNNAVINGSWNGLINFETSLCCKSAIPCRKEVTFFSIVSKLLACWISQIHAQYIAHV